MRENVVKNNCQGSFVNCLKKAACKVRNFFRGSQSSAAPSPTVNATTLDLQRLDALETMVRYQHYKISDLRKRMRYLAAQSQESFPERTQTKSSFDYQWNQLNEGKFLVSDKEFVKNLEKTICQYTAFDKDWFKGKTVLDAGCGQGRFTLGFCRLNANVTAFDQSPSAISFVKENCKEYSNLAEARVHNIFDPLDFVEPSDLVWSYGVIHHTGNTYKAFSNLIKKVKVGGYLFLMVYGEPELDNTSSFAEQLEYSRLRHLCQNKTNEEKVDILKEEKPPEHLHGWFDAISPHINDTYSFTEIESWLLASGFGEVKRTFDNANHHIIAKRVN